MVAVRVVLVLAALAAAAACDVGPTSETPVAREGCEAEADAVFWGGTQWAELAQGLAANASKCVQYFVTVPPSDSDRTELRDAEAFDELRSLGPRIHPVAEIRYTGETGWREWAQKEKQTSYEAGVEARRRMEEAGLDVENGETWAFNELSTEVLANEAGWREDVLEFMRGLYDGPPGVPRAPGIVFNIFVPSDTTDLDAYKTSLKAWLEDDDFWRGIAKYVDFFAQEVYPNPVNWGVANASVEQRRNYLQDYLFHMFDLARAGSKNAAAAGEVLGTTYVPLANASWPHEGIGRTNAITAEAMRAFVSAQVDAIRRVDGATREDKRHKIGFAWAPNAAESGYSDDGRDVVLEGLAAALRAAYEDDGDPCADDACAADVDGAAFNDAWKTFATWD